MEGDRGDSVDMVDILVTSSINSFVTQRRFSKDIHVLDLKSKLELLTGASSSMQLQLLDKNKKLIAKLTDNNALLKSYPIENGMCIHVIDASVQCGEFEDVSKVKKFEISEEEYNKRGDSIRALKEKLKLSNPDSASKEGEKEKKWQEEAELIKSFSIGDRCEVRISGQPEKRGTIMYLGKTDFKPGYWVGVKLDEPLGKNDGSVQGKRYFECAPKYGNFVKPHDVTVGDFKEKEIDEI